MPVFSYTISLDEQDLRKVLTEIKSVNQVQDLGLALGLLPSAIDEIQKDLATVKDQRREVIKYWLNRRQIIRDLKSCPPTWSQLADAVAEENAALGDCIQCQYCITLP